MNTFTWRIYLYNKYKNYKTSVLVLCIKHYSLPWHSSILIKIFLVLDITSYIMISKLLWTYSYFTLKKIFIPPGKPNIQFCNKNMIQYIYTQKQWIKITWMNQNWAALDFINFKYICSKQCIFWAVFLTFTFEEAVL